MAGMGKWVKRARCASGEPGINPKDFQVPLRGDSQNKAKLVCAECPVQQECLRWALENQELWGVWGGLDESEIRKTLSVDTFGRYARRSRTPGCPNLHCRARPSELEIIPTGRIPTIKCQLCGFSWRSATSATALRLYQRTRALRERQRQRQLAKMTNARVPQKDTRAPAVPIYPGSTTQSAGEDLPAPPAAAE